MATLYAFSSGSKILLIAQECALKNETNSVNIFATEDATDPIENGSFTLTTATNTYNSSEKISVAHIETTLTDLEDKIIKAKSSTGATLAAKIVAVTGTTTETLDDAAGVSADEIDAPGCDDAIVVFPFITESAGESDKYGQPSQLFDSTNITANKIKDYAYRDNTVYIYGLTKETDYKAIIIAKGEDDCTAYSLWATTGSYSELQADYQKKNLFVLKDSDTNPVNGNSTNSVYWTTTTYPAKQSAQAKYGKISGEFTLPFSTISNKKKVHSALALFTFTDDTEIADNEALINKIKTASNISAVQLISDDIITPLEGESVTTPEYTPVMTVTANLKFVK